MPMTTTDGSVSEQALQDQSVAELTRRLADSSVRLVQQEVELARAEIEEKSRRAIVGAGMIGEAGMILMCAMGALTAAAILGLATSFDAWLSALIVGGALALIAGALALVAKNRIKHANPVPERAIESMKEDAQWTKQRIETARQL